MNEYRYYSIDRQPSAERLPRRGLVYADAWKQMRYVFNLKVCAWGTAVYSRPLSAEELEEHGLRASERGGEE